MIALIGDIIHADAAGQIFREIVGKFGVKHQKIINTAISAIIIAVIRLSIQA